MNAKRFPRPRPAAILCLLTAIGLSLVGITAMRSTAPGEAAQQVRWLAIGLVMATLVFLPAPRTIGRAAMPILIAHLIVLAIMLAPFTPSSLVPTINGARSWINLAGNRFQPSETAKVAYVLAVAWRLRHASAFRRWRGLFLELGIMMLPVALIVKQPDLGSALVFAPTLFIMLLAAGAKLRHMFALLAIGLIALALVITAVVVDPPHERGITGKGKLPGWAHVLASHQEKRIAALVWPKRYENREAFQQITATRLAGAGGIVGVGKERATTLIRYNRLPEPHNDMIFSVILCR